MTDQVLVIYNPSLKSQVQNEEWMGQLVHELSRCGQYLISFYATAPETRAADLLPLLVPALKLVIAAGGDGTIRLVLAALALAKSPVPAALFPIGTGNVLARNLGIVDHHIMAKPLEHVFEYIVHGRTMRMDMGMMNGEYFAGMAGAGPLAEAFMLPERTAKNKAKLWPYIKALLNTIALPQRVFKITTGGKSFKIQASGIFISNVCDLGLGKNPDLEQLKDGYLDLHIINPLKVKDYFALVQRYAAGNLQDNPADCIIKVKEAVVELVPRMVLPSACQNIANELRRIFTGKKVLPKGRVISSPCMIDGDEFSVTPMRVTVVPQAINILVPNQVLPGLQLPAIKEPSELAVLEPTVKDNCVQLPIVSGQ